MFDKSPALPTDGISLCVLLKKADTICAMDGSKDIKTLKILVVDDEEFIGRHLMMTLFSIGLKDVTFIDSGPKAVSAASEHRYDLVLTDKEMQPMNGFELVSELRGRHSGDELKIVMVSADNSDETIATVIKRGADDFIAKPYSPDSIRAVLGKLFPDLAA